MAQVFCFYCIFRPKTTVLLSPSLSNLCRGCEHLGGHESGLYGSVQKLSDMCRPLYLWNIGTKCHKQPQMKFQKIHKQPISHRAFFHFYHNFRQSRLKRMTKMKSQTPFKSVHLKEYGLMIMECTPQSADIVSVSYSFLC